MAKVEQLTAERGIAGGKGVNLSILKELLKGLDDIRIPPTMIISTIIYDQFLRNNRPLTTKIHSLDTAVALEDKLEIASQIRHEFNKQYVRELPHKEHRRIFRFLFDCGADSFAVRSSAVDEDDRKSAAAGYGDSFLDVRQDDVISAIIAVWASNFNAGFIRLRHEQDRLNSTAQMAVVIQPYIEAHASGVVMTSDAFGRPGFHIESANGCGDVVVSGAHQVHRVIVNLECTEIVEGTLAESRITHNQAIEISRVVHFIREYYREHNLAKEIDVEFCIDNNGIVILQARAEEVRADLDISTRLVKTIDPEEASRYQSVAINGYAASMGAAHGKLKILPKPLPAALEAGDVLMVEHTNNSFNAIFPLVAGLVTWAGGANSHAAKNSRSIGIPCITSARISKVDFERIQAWNGSMVTFDSLAKQVFKGLVPLVADRIHLDIWEQ